MSKTNARRPDAVDVLAIKRSSQRIDEAIHRLIRIRDSAETLIYQDSWSEDDKLKSSLITDLVDLYHLDKLPHV